MAPNRWNSLKKRATELGSKLAVHTHIKKESSKKKSTPRPVSKIYEWDVTAMMWRRIKPLNPDCAVQRDFREPERVSTADPVQRSFRKPERASTAVNDAEHEPIDTPPPSPERHRSWAGQSNPSEHPSADSDYSELCAAIEAMKMMKTPSEEAAEDSD
ncbi:hypothetical protein EJ06DRAFT_559989 [Trichodelitschia bisporula]|uniref:Uncharacterized protein n=1 Tax=Trichodelitschia bisporula TaxID=703511 RepID=A0A6G1HK36_9PEZI|nr:hypothetical protein EJ06DRAFT_559989 [Trichodelitschia bisporula]